MLKRIMILLIAVIIPVTLIFTGCGNVSAENADGEAAAVEYAPKGAKLTVAEYRETLVSEFKEYSVSLSSVPLFSENDTVAELKPHWTEARKTCGKCCEALDKFGEMNPPDEFAEKHRKLLECAGREKEYVLAIQRFLTSTSESELKKHAAELKEIAGHTNEQSFSSMYLELIGEVKAAAYDESTAS